jgi:uncharacterized protein YjdB
MSKIVFISMAACMFSTASAAEICYAVHVQGLGNLNWVCNGEEAGTVLEYRQIEAVWIRTRGLPRYGKGCFQTHLANYGWTHSTCEDQASYNRDGQLVFPGSGTVNENRQAEAIRVWLQNAPGYGVTYQVHAAKLGWMDWKSDGQLAGTTGQGRRIEAIKVRFYTK